MERDLLLTELRGSLLGPREFDERLRDVEYITGILERNGAKPDLEAEMISRSSERSAGDSGDPGDHVVIDSSFQGKIPSSMGVTFILGGPSRTIDICATWANYIREDGSKEMVRRAFSQIVDGYVLESSSVSRIFIEDDVEMILKTNEDGSGNTIVTIFMVNRSNIRVYQPQLRINIGNDCSLLPMRPEAIPSDEDSASLDFLYRNRKGLCRGHLVSTLWKDIDPEGSPSEGRRSFDWIDGVALDEEDRTRFTCPDLRTEYLPAVPVVSPDLNSWPGFSDSDPVLRALEIALCESGEELYEKLLPLKEGYSRWMEITFGALGTLEPRAVIERHKKGCEESVRRIGEGLDLIRDVPAIRAAFQFSNMAIHNANCWKGDGGFSWRPFQLAFIIQNIGGFSDRSHEDRGICDLLWFPTGGGKTEAYLGLSSFIMSFRRLRHPAEEGLSFHSGGGVSVISRYTLRLLTIQQFRRGASVVTSCEFLRVKKTPQGIGWRPSGCGLSGDYPWGNSSFSIGLWAGGGVTPNNMRSRTMSGGIQLKGALRGKNNEKGLFNERDSESGEPGQLISCPACSSLLSLPSEGVLEGVVTKIFLTIKEEPNDFSGLAKRMGSSEGIGDCEIGNLIPIQGGGFVLDLSIKPSKDLSPKKFNRIIWEAVGVGYHCFDPTRPGYFPIMNNREVVDYAIICPDPSCQLNHGVEWVDSTPSGKRPYPEAFSGSGGRCPIPALTVDEEIYSRCPSMIISTVDKFAQLAFKPECGNLFGNIEAHHPKHGYVRDTKGIYGSGFHLDNIADEEGWVDLRDYRFVPPDFVLQDELHLIDGPLGSVVGLYEIAIKEMTRFSGDRGAKYISSTATARNAGPQISSLYGLRMTVFPPLAVDAEDSFWSRSGVLDSGEVADPTNGVRRPDPMDEDVPGRLYVGLCSLGQSMQWTTVASWSAALQHVHERRASEGVNRDRLDRYWTLVGYFNAIRELAAARTVVAQDIIGRLGHLSKENGTSPRERSYLDTMDLSSRTPSVALPSMLSRLEEPMGTDVVIATSMFGTGVDIDRLGLMFVMGQPKTTSSYIQATGRVGRSGGGLVFTMLRGGRPRDLNHYEFFSSYHNELYRHVEPVSVHPFSSKSVQRALGPVIVALLRQAAEINGVELSKEWRTKELGEGGWLQSGSGDVSLREEILSVVKAHNSSQPEKRKMPEDELESFVISSLHKWKVISELNEDLVYNEYTLNRGAERPVVLGSEGHELRGLDMVFERAPNSMRDVESTINFESREEEFNGA